MTIQQINHAALSIKSIYPDATYKDTEEGILIDFKDETMTCVFILEPEYCSLSFFENGVGKALFWKSDRFSFVIGILSSAKRKGKNLRDVFKLLLYLYLQQEGG